MESHAVGNGQSHAVGNVLGNGQSNAVRNVLGNGQSNAVGNVLGKYTMLHDACFFFNSTCSFS
jgi:hypothetical protein